jgi:hypothetical protein
MIMVPCLANGTKYIPLQQKGQKESGRGDAMPLFFYFFFKIYKGILLFRHTGERCLGKVTCIFSLK